MISASDFKKCLQSTIEPFIKRVANQQDTSFENISNLARNVDMCLYRNFGDEDLIVKIKLIREPTSTTNCSCIFTAGGKLVDKTLKNQYVYNLGYFKKTKKI
ncbi:MAG: hypothetical protein EBW68_09625, partial [Actinobacteria bacterium]|nr:hypothetical protein [Actinomycetota bacterium]